MTVVVITVVLVTVVTGLVTVVVSVVGGPSRVEVVVMVVVVEVIKPGMPDATAVIETAPNVIASTASVKKSLFNRSISLFRS